MMNIKESDEETTQDLIQEIMFENFDEEIIKIQEPIEEKTQDTYLSSANEITKFRTNQTHKRANKSNLKLISLNIFFLLFRSAFGCIEIVTLTAQESKCAVSSDGSHSCTLNQATRLVLAPQGQQSCLLVQNNENNNIGTLFVEVEDVALKCNAKTLYFTRSVEIKVNTEKRCPTMGSCTGSKCKETTKETKINELGEANDHLGITNCAESCSCWSCHCFICSSACIFWRIFTVPKSDTVYEIFECPSWTYQIHVKLRMEANNNSWNEELFLVPGLGKTIRKLNVAVVALTPPELPLLTTQFITDGNKVTMIRGSMHGQPISGTIGMIQCPTRDDASKMNCRELPHDICNCVPRDESVACYCREVILEDIFSNSQRTLPLEHQGITLVGQANDIHASLQGTSALELQLAFSGYQLTTKFDKSRCTINPYKLNGCYKCLSGAKFIYGCQVNFGTAQAYVTCETTQFVALCPSDNSKSVTLALRQPNIKEKCKVYCPGGETEFVLEGKLVFIEEEHIGRTSSIIASSKRSSEIDMNFLISFFKSNWAYIFIIGGIIIIFAILTVSFLLKTLYK